MRSVDLCKFKILSGSALKLIAVISMFIDHGVHIMYSELDFLNLSLFAWNGKEITTYFLLRKVGRMAFPIFAFLIAEGFAHTKNPEKYGRRILLFAVVSEIPFNLMMKNSLLYPAKQNTYVTLFLGWLLIYLYENVKNDFWKIVLMGAVALAAVGAHADYGLKGALLILLLYVLRDNPAPRTILAYPFLSGGIAAFAAFGPIILYNGERGFIRSRWLKLGFYLFYPLHIMLLLGIRMVLRG